MILTCTSCERQLGFHPAISGKRTPAEFGWRTNGRRWQCADCAEAPFNPVAERAAVESKAAHA